MSTIPGIVDKAVKSGMNAIAVTDQGNMFGIKEFLNYVNKINLGKEAGSKFKPIVGVEVYCARRTRFDRTQNDDRSGWRLILLAKNKKGYQNLCKLVSIAWNDGFYYRPRIDKDILKQYSEGLIACSACLKGEIPCKIAKMDLNGAKEAVLWFKEVFGDDFYLELQRYPNYKSENKKNNSIYDKQEFVNMQIVELANNTNTKLIASNNVHFVDEEHADAHDCFIRIGSCDLNNSKRLRYTKQEWLKTPEEMYRIFSDIPEALQNTVEVADKVEFYSIDNEPMIPKIALPKEFTNEDDYLKHLTCKGAERNYNEITEEIRQRIDFELEVIKKNACSGYFLIIHDIIQAARNMGVVVGTGRGAAVGSVVNYCLGITSIDPFKYDLLFERFLNPDRISMPDIDIDFDSEGLEEILSWITEKYGKEKVAHIITFGAWGPKSSIKDVARILRLPLSETKRLTKLIPDYFNSEIKANITNCLKYIPELKEALESGDEKLSNTLKYAEMLEGIVYKTGTHACGIVIGRDDLTDFVPLSTVMEYVNYKNIAVTQYEAQSIEEIGLIRFDFLGLRTLSVIKRTLSNIKKSKGIDLDISKIPTDDAKTFELYSKGDTQGIFQFESAGMQKYLLQLQPDKLEDLIALNALYRPGALAYIPYFIERKKGREEITYDFPKMESRLKETYGIYIYQEQMMLLSQDLAGFTPGESDELRRAMGRRQADKLEELKVKFMDGATKNGFAPKEKLEKIWANWADASCFLFNKSHAVSYTLISYQTAYLKANFPEEFEEARKYNH